MMKIAYRSSVWLAALALVTALALSGCGGSDEPTATHPGRPRRRYLRLLLRSLLRHPPPSEPSEPTATPGAWRSPHLPRRRHLTSAPPPPTATPLPSFDAEAHFKGKTIRMVVGFNPGGGTDTQARFLAAKWGAVHTRQPSHRRQ